MSKKIQASLALIFFVCAFCSAPVMAENEKVLRVRDGKIISFEQMMDDVKQVSVVFIGENHDEPEHHKAQLDIIRALHESGKPAAIGLEMFRAESQEALDSWVLGKLPLEYFLPVYYNNWGMPWPLYRDILVYAKEQRIPIRGLNIPDGISKKIARQGFESLTQEEKKQLPPGIGCNVDHAYMEFIRRAYAGAHAHGNGEFLNFCEAQMVWDKSMAMNLAGYLRKNPGRTMAVLAGVGHAWKRGIAEQLPADAKLSYRVVLPSVPNKIDRATVTMQDADYILLLG